MKFYRKAQVAAETVVNAFETGRIPSALAQVFITREDDSPCRKWSWRNQLLVALAGHADARGFKQWKGVGRSVRKGEHARCHILVPVMVKKDDDGEDTRLVGFTSSAVFGLTQTDGDPLPTGDPALDAWLDALPLRALAESWGLAIQTYNGETSSALGWYAYGSSIALGTKNLSTWAHELCHAADDRLGELMGSNKPDREVVAELAGATLLECLGHHVESDPGGAWGYVLRQCEGKREKALSACNRLLERVCNAVSLILDESAALDTVQAAVSA